LIKYIKSVLWRVAERLSYIEDAWCLKVNSAVPIGTLLHYDRLVLHTASQKIFGWYPVLTEMRECIEHFVFVQYIVPHISSSLSPTAYGSDVVL